MQLALERKAQHLSHVHLVRDSCLYIVDDAYLHTVLDSCLRIVVTPHKVRDSYAAYFRAYAVRSRVTFVTHIIRDPYFLHDKYTHTIGGATVWQRMRVSLKLVTHIYMQFVTHIARDSSSNMTNTRIQLVA